MARAKTLRFAGRYNTAGEPDRWFTGIPARDLDEAEVRGLSDEDYANATGGDSPLYVAPEPKKTAAKAPAKRPAAAKKAAPKPKAAAPKAAASAPVVATAPAGSDAAQAPETPAP